VGSEIPQYLIDFTTNLAENYNITELQKFEVAQKKELF